MEILIKQLNLWMTIISWLIIRFFEKIIYIYKIDQYLDNNYFVFQ
ncbi:hypothetical protein Patl1_15452 [Pistacia atlantica]|uniref:Uncharacterized protein n=1 Tax=Pistacia atlantica TaxID=434234 RepID=A0ACC1BAL7_9ROSI|nr:hypothetical protein Patl1_15452 [Pistacia atlantica]